MKTWEVLERAADEIERDGWFQGCGAGELDAACVHIAIDRVCMEDDIGPYVAAMRAFGVGIGVTHTDEIWDWNDAPGRTAVEVIAMLRAVAASEKARAAVTVETRAEAEA